MNNYLTQATAEREFDLAIGRETQPYHSGACARDISDTPVRTSGRVERLVLGTIKINLRTGEIIEPQERK